MSSATSRATGDRRWLILVVVAIAQLMVVLDSTIVNIALPSAQHALGFPNNDRQWVVTAYALAFGSLLLVGGRLGDMFSRKWVFITGLIGFAGASAIGGASVSFAMLVAARALQGAFGAILAPSALGTLVSTFQDPRERGRAFGVFGSVAAGGGAVMLRHRDHDMAGALLVAECTAHRRWPQPLPSRAFVHETLRDEQLVHVERRAGVFGLAFRVGDGAAQHFFDVLRGALGGEPQRLQRVLHFAPANQIDHQPRLLRRHPHVLGKRVRFDRTSLLCLHVNHRLCLRRRRSRAASRGCARPCRSRACRALERCFHGVAFERARGRKLAQLVTNHLLGHIHGNEFLPVVHRDGVANHVRHDRRAPRPRLHDFLFVSRVQSFDLFAQVAVNKRPLFQ